MDLICYLTEEWKPRIRPAEATREWMDNTRFAYAYRCLPLNIANSHGWEILSPVSFEAVWDGSVAGDGITITAPADTPTRDLPISLFGEGVLTFHVNGLFRTPPGWNLWIGGSPNRPKDGIYPLAGVVETDWSPYTFTMNWRFTRRNHRVRFEVGEPFCFIFPLQRAVLDTVKPRFLPLVSEPQLAAHHAAWSKSRDDFNTRIARDHPFLPASEQWQKRYYRGHDMTEQPVVADHIAKLRLSDFAPITPGDTAGQDPAAPVLLQTDTTTLGQVMGDVAAAARSGREIPDSELDALAKRLGALGLGASEAMEIILTALDRAQSDAT